MNTSKRSDLATSGAQNAGEGRAVRPRREPQRRGQEGEQQLVALIGRLTIQNSRQLREQASALQHSVLLRLDHFVCR
eukprot:13613608-Heterocapsa_arctica.AAC.1